jgi:replicative DNA helicase
MNNENNNYQNDEKKALLASSNQRRRNNTFSDFPQGGLDKLPPQVIDLEEVVLGSMMLDKDAVSEVIDILTPDSFYLEKNQLIFKAIHDLFNKSEPVDILTVVAQLRKSGNLDAVGGAMYVTMLTTRVGSTSNIEFHARIINEKHIMRELIRSSSEVMKEAYEETSDVFDVLDKAEQNLFNITQSNLRRSYEDMGSLVAKALEQLQLLKGHEDGVVGVPSGLTALDRITSGWQKSDLVIVAARPAMGKCLGKGTKILMYDGSLKKVEDIKVGDYLMGDDSTPRRVLSLARGRENMYWIRQNKGIDYRVNESHILSLKRSRTDNKHQHGDILNISVAEYLTKSNKFKSNYKGYKVAVTFEHQNLPLAPYFMGLWLGDKHLISAPLSNSQTNTAAQSAPNNHNNQVPEAILRQLGLLNNKHIPQQYLINSTQNRLELLAGLIDSDGYYDAQFNCYEIVQKNKLLAEQIKFLCDSLGFRTSLVPKMATINQRNYATEVYRVRFFGNLDTIPTKIKRKQARPLKAVADWHVTGITVEFDQEDDYYGFEIDGNRLFLLEDMTVTHNTAFTLSIARNAAVEFGKAIAFFSLEMSAVQLVNRLISAETGIAADKLKKGTLEDYEWTQLSEKVERLAEAKIFIDDTPAINIFELRAKCRRLKMQHDIQLIVVDYLQLMSGSTGEKTRASGNREQEISMISRSLKSIAKELNVPVIALSQLSRAVETRGGDKRPMLSDLRESGSIEQDADMVIFLYRPEYYGFDQDEEGNSSRGVAEVIIAKHRNGATDTAKVRFIAQNAKFTDLDNNFGGFGTDLNPIGDIITFGSRMNDFGSTPPSSGNSTPTNNKRRHTFLNQTSTHKKHLLSIAQQVFFCACTQAIACHIPIVQYKYRYNRIDALCVTIIGIVA